MTTLPPFDHSPQVYDGPSITEVLDMRKEYLSPALMTYYKKPIMIVEGKQQVCFFVDVFRIFVDNPSISLMNMVNDIWIVLLES